MKAIKYENSFFSQSNKSHSRIAFSGEKITNIVPTPKDFDSFIPWLCFQLEVPRIITVKRIDQGKYRTQIKQVERDSKIFKFYNGSKEGDLKATSSSKSSDAITLTINTDDQYTLQMQTYYTKGLLVEVAFINCSLDIHRKIIRAISMCLPFHPGFYRLTIKGGGLIKSTLDEVSKLLPYSNITDVCLDDNPVTAGNYHIILEKESNLQNLSLRRCNIDEKICKEIASKLANGAPASKNLITLDLTSNRINDEGAQALGHMLRSNRMLLYLNISDNKITDTGASHIFNSMLSILLTGEDIHELKIIYLKYCIKKVKLYRKRDNITLCDQTDKMAKEIFSNFIDILDDNIKIRHGQICRVGNLRLCYLNIAYNNISYISVKKVYEILKYQRTLSKSAKCKGLIRVVLDGNNIPKACEELTAIQSYLQEAVSPESNHTSTKKKRNFSKSNPKNKQKVKKGD